MPHVAKRAVIIPEEKEGCQTASVDGSSQGSAATEDGSHIDRRLVLLIVVVVLDEDGILAMDIQAIYQALTRTDDLSWWNIMSHVRRVDHIDDPYRYTTSGNNLRRTLCAPDSPRKRGWVPGTVQSTKHRGDQRIVPHVSKFSKTSRKVNVPRSQLEQGSR